MTDAGQAIDLTGRTALITGASRGFGAAVATALGRAGARLVLTARTVGGLEETDDAIRAAGGAAATLIPLDLADLDKVDALGPALYERFQCLDILVSAAATLQALSPVSHMQPAHWATTFRVNVEAGFRLIRTLDPLLRRAPAGRAVFVTDSAGRPGTAYWNAYAASKAALDTLVLSWAGELLRTPLRVNLYDPGPMRTGLRAIAFPGEDPQGRALPAERVASLLPLLAPDATAHGTRVSAGDQAGLA
ncbi:MAG: SDR family NAD(P)-dependent oxidoreductase [Alphaproteobacteria bacterium]